METKKVLGLIFSLLFIGAFAFVLSWGIINFNKVKDGMSGTGLYTQEDINKSYEDGYNTALQDKNEYEQLINSYRDTITNQTDQISQLNSQVVTLTNNNKDYANQIRNLESQKSNLQSQVDNLTTIKTNNEITIASLQSQVATLQNEVETLTNSGEDKDELITQKNNQIASLQTTVSQLQRTNELNVETITNLNNQIASLNNQISDMSLQIQNNSANVTSLNNKIAELEKSVAYYEQYIANLENETQVVVTFEFNGSVYNIQIVNKNSTVSVVDPTSTDYVVFNYWTVDGQQIDLLTYQFATNTKVVADVTYKYDVKFIVDDSVYNSQIVIKNDYATIPTNPTKNGYEFDGWSINGVDVVNPNTTAITQNTTYVAKFTKLHTVTFMYEDTVYSTQTIRNNEYSSNVVLDNTTYKIFNGWKLNGVIVDLSNTKIVADTTFVADITYKYDVKFIVDDSVYNSQIVIKNDYATIPTNPTKNGYEFDGWSINGVDVVNPNTTAITQNTTYVAKFTKLHTVTFMYEDTVYSTQTIRNNEYSSNVVVDNTTYKIFNGWKLNGVIVDLSNTKIVADTTFVADITYKYDVKFMVDDSVYNSQIVIKNGYATIPTNPAKPGHEFAGWSFNGIDVVDIETLPVTSNINYTAIFTKSIVSLTAQNYLNYVYKIGENNITNIVFDYYTSNNEYIVDGVNVINGLSGNSLDSDNKISLYQKDSSLYILSNYSIQIDTGLRLFYNNRSLTSIFLNNFDTSNVTNMNKMFYNCSSLTTLDLSNFNTSNVTNMSFMFETCQSLTTLDLSNFDTRSVTNMSYMFTGCRALTFVNLSSFDTSNVEYMMGMFDGCSNLTTLDLSTFNTAKVRRFEVMFRSCSALTTIYANENFVTTSVEVDEVNYIDGRKWMFLQCEKLVGAISYDSKKTDCSYANYSNGYFTYKAKA